MMKPVIAYASLCLALVAPSVVNAAGNPIRAEGAAGSSSSLENLLNPSSKATTQVAPLRAQMLTEAAYTVGFRGSVAHRAAQLSAGLRARAESLDRMFQFGPLISRSGTISPVIVQAQDVSAVSSEQIRTGSHVYRIEKDERFVSLAPTWRDYLFMGLAALPANELPAFQSRPQDGHELALWRDSVTRGWEEGGQHADSILEANFNRLTRDYTGMILYATLLRRGMVSASRVAESSQVVTGDARQIVVGDTLRRLVGRAAFDTDYRNWIPSVSYGPALTGPKPASGAPPVSGPAAAVPAQSGAKYRPVQR